MTKGEKVSIYLLGKEKKRKNNAYITKLRREDGSLVKGTESISIALEKHFEMLYSSVDIHKDSENYLLNGCCSILDDGDKDMLKGDIREE